ncbi:MAG TPA: M90 family metallopeptidase [Gammaproteobacteria bacterium]
MLSFFDRWRERRILKRHPIAEADWRTALKRSAPLARLDASDQARLRVMATLLLHDKSIEPVRGLELASADRAWLAALACLPVLKLGLRWYREWHSIVVYPDAFVPEREHVDEAGVVHRHRTPLSGEAWEQGPVILAWEEVAGAGATPGHNVVIHEMAHKLDMLNGDANGFPPLHARMSRRIWVQVLGGAFRQLEQRVDAGYPPPLDPYGLESPGEFFAVASEAFFETPRRLRNFSPELYQQLALFYRQRPLPE